MSNTSQVNAEEQLILMVIAGLGAPALLVWLGASWDQATAWATATGLLVAASAQPLVVIPGAAGAGLDLPRLMIVVGVTGLLLAWPVIRIRRAWRRRQEIR